MNMIYYTIKYIEYLIRKFRSFFITDFYFHTTRLYKITAKYPNLKKPETLSEKICHRLIFDHDPLYTLLADKLAVREYVQTKTQLVKIVPLIGVYNKVTDIDFNKLPDIFVLKCNHDSGSTIICTDKKKFDSAKAMRKLKLALSKNMYYITKEWQYKNIRPVILCEKYIDFSSCDITMPKMLRIHCFHSAPIFAEADFTDQNGNEFINVYDSLWQLQTFKMEFPNTPNTIQMPESFHVALAAAKELSQELDYCRIDLMLKGDEVYFSEITLSPMRGKLKITPQTWDARLGNMWDLPLRKTNLK
ncbi:ATP-grasp fold amidoligase family protein [Citrobacter werkmanii]|uniref:ATP-grasp fold amidoligase family protein n=1 Tax=Citrobacter werkmanii TaxID=67827 RepID=UPI002F2CAF5A